MKVPFPPIEINNTHNKTKCHKSPRIYDIHAEQVQNGPIEG